MSIVATVLLLLAAFATAAIGSGDNTAALVSTILFFPIVFLLYFMPTFVAAVRHRENMLQIGALNFFAGWTLVGWLGALIWAYAPNRE